MYVLEAVKGILSAVVGTFVMLVYGPLNPPRLPDAMQSEDHQGRRVLVTGANSGIGKEIALHFASRGAEVFLLCRNEKKALSTQADIRKQTGNESVFIEVMDLASFKSISLFVERWMKRPSAERTIDLLYNNAGGTNANKRFTTDGFEYTYQISFLSSFLLTASLLNNNVFCPAARIIQTTSHAMYVPHAMDPSNLNSKDLTRWFNNGDNMGVFVSSFLYCRAKALQVLWTSILQERLMKSGSKIVVQCYHPGWVSTGFWTDPSGLAAHGLNSAISQLIGRIIGLSPAQGAVPAIYLATAPIAEIQRGRYWDRFSWRWVPAWMHDDRLRNACWRTWEKDTGLASQPGM